MSRPARLAAGIAACLGLAVVVAAGVAAVPSSGAAGDVRTSTTGTSSSTTSTSSTSTSSTSTVPASSTTTVAPNQPVVLLSGGSVAVAVPFLPADLNPWTPQGSDPVTAQVAAQLWPSVFDTAPNGSLQVDPSLVTSAEVIGVPPAGGFTVQYLINPKAEWSDGVPITVTDFVYLWQQMRLAKDLPPTVPLAGYDDVASITGSNGGRTVTVTFTTPDADWEELFADLVPAHLAEAGGFAGAFATAGGVASSVSGGPFVIAGYVPGSSLTLARNPRWWGTPARLARLVFQVERGSTATIRALQNGTVDVAELGPSAALDDDVAASRDLVAHPQLSGTMWQLVYNQADPLLTHLAVRRAVSDAVDRRELQWDTVGLDDPASQLSVNHLAPAGTPGPSASSGPYEVADDPAADALLIGAGFTRNAAALITRPDGAPLTLQLVGPSGNGLAARIEGLLTAQLLDAGITLEVRNVPLRQLLTSVLPAGEFQIALAPYLLAPSPEENVRLYLDPVGPIAPATVDSPGGPMATPAELLAPGTSTGLPGALVAGAVTRDVGGYEDRGLAAMATQAFGELNPARLAAMYNRIDQRIWANLPTLPLFQVPFELVVRDDVVNVSVAPTAAGPLWNASTWGIQVSPIPATTTTLP